MGRYYGVLEKLDVMNLKAGMHLPKVCFEYIDDERKLLLNSPAFDDSSEEEKIVADKVNLSYSLFSFISSTFHVRQSGSRFTIIRRSSNFSGSQHITPVLTKLHSTIRLQLLRYPFSTSFVVVSQVAIYL